MCPTRGGLGTTLSPPRRHRPTRGRVGCWTCCASLPSEKTCCDKYAPTMSHSSSKSEKWRIRAGNIVTVPRAFRLGALGGQRAARPRTNAQYLGGWVHLGPQRTAPPRNKAPASCPRAGRDGAGAQQLNRAVGPRDRRDGSHNATSGRCQRPAAGPADGLPHFVADTRTFRVADTSGCRPTVTV